MARQKSSALPSSNEKAQQAQRDAMIDNPETNRKAALRAQHRKGPLSWNIKQADQAPVRLAIKNHFVAMVGEYVGTTLFLLLALGATNVANIPTTSVTGATAAGEKGSTVAAVNTSSLLYIALAFGFSLAVNAWIFFRVSGGLFNPAVSLGMALVGALTPLRAALLTISQILGGITGAAIVHAILPGTLNVRTQLGGGTSVARGLFIEMFMTSMLMITILLLAAEKHKATFLAPIGIGLALFIAELMSVYYTGGSLNPARSFGPCVVVHEFNHYHWIYWLGPAMGATLAAGFYKFIKYLEYETVLGPEADADEESKRPVNMTQAGPSSALTGGAVPAPTMLGTTAGTTNKSSGPTLATQGAGLGDLLTHGEPGKAFDLEANSAPHYNNRLDRIEMMLSELISSTHLSPRTTGTEVVSEGGADARHSMTTFTSDSPVVHDKSKLLPTVEHERTTYDRSAAYNGREHAYDRSSESSGGQPALATPVQVDFGRLAGHISDDNVRRL